MATRLFSKSLSVHGMFFLTVTTKIKAIAQDTIKQPAKPEINLSNRFCTQNSQIHTYFSAQHGAIPA